MPSRGRVAAAEHVHWLRGRWSARFPESPAIGEAVIARYADRGRVYHDVRHLSEVLQRVDALAAEAVDLETVELAAWFHDAVYDVRSDDNEASSAGLARRLLTPYRTGAQLEEVARLVLLTRDHAVGADDANGAVLCDADLAVLASGPADYGEYTSRVRQEYAHVSDEAFRAGRAAVLRRLLDLPTLFYTGYGGAHWEAPARANLTAELALLTR